MVVVNHLELNNRGISRLRCIAKVMKLDWHSICILRIVKTWNHLFQEGRELWPPPLPGFLNEQRDWFIPSDSWLPQALQQDLHSNNNRRKPGKDVNGPHYSCVYTRVLSPVECALSMEACVYTAISKASWAWEDVRAGWAGLTFLKWAKHGLSATCLLLTLV